LPEIDKIKLLIRYLRPENQTDPKKVLGRMSNLEPIPYNQPDVLDDDAYPITQTCTDITEKNEMQLKGTS
jgi:hypothetical protein